MDSLLLRLPDLPVQWREAPSLPWPFEVVVREGVLPGRDAVVSRERSRDRDFPWSNLGFRCVLSGG